MRSLLSLGRARGAAAKTVDGRGVVATGWSVRGAAFVLTLGVSLAISAPALAATPETPETGHASAVTANTATLEGGVLNPNAAGEAGEYGSYYEASETRNVEDRAWLPVPEGIAIRIEKGAVAPVKLTALKSSPAVHVLFPFSATPKTPEEVSAASARSDVHHAQRATGDRKRVRCRCFLYVEGSAGTTERANRSRQRSDHLLLPVRHERILRRKSQQSAHPESGTGRQPGFPAAGMSALQPGSDLSLPHHHD